MTWIQLKAKNDTNGNPRRVWMGFQGDTLASVWDDALRGGPVPSPHWTIDVPVSEYRKAMKEGERLGVLDQG